MPKTIVQILVLIGLFLLKLFGQKVLLSTGTSSFDTIINYISFVITANLVKNFYFRFYRKQKKLKPRTTDNIISGINNIYVLLIGIVGIFTGLSLLGIDIKALLASLSIIAAALAIISKDYISNVIGGMLIAFSNDVNVGDFVKVGNYQGKVMDMSISSFNLLTDDDDVVVIPNSIVYALGMMNNSKLALKKTSIEFEVEMSQLQSVKQLEEDLIATMEEYNDLIQPESYNLKIGAIKFEYIDFKFQYMLKEPNRELEKTIRKKVIRRVVQIIKKL